VSAENVWLIGQMDQIASTMLSRAVQASSSCVRSASPTIAIAASSSAQPIAHAIAALPNSRHS
jgi:AcrR family transcriptional regulator